MKYFTRSRWIPACVMALIASPAFAFDIAPWDPRPFDQPGQMNARSQALVATARATAVARTSTSVDVGGAVSGQRQGCSINVGNVVLPAAAAGGRTVVNDVTVRGTIINVCR